MIEEGATLYLTGKGNVVAKGGDGAKAGDAFLNTTITYKTEITGGPLFDNNLTVVSGFGQRGGVGANAPSAGIGGSGGKGGESSDRSEADHEGTFGESSGIYSRYVVNNDGANGCKGGDGTSMGTLYVVDSVVVQSTPGANISYVGKSGYYNDRGQTHISKSHYKDHNSTLKWVVGATGGGGGSSSGAASIGGGGAGGGGGASGTSGSFYFDYYGNVSDVTFTSTYYNGQNGSSSKGGDGGLAQSVIDPNGEYLNVKVGVGGSIGTAGLGGNLYVSETATINGKKVIN